MDSSGNRIGISVQEKNMTGKRKLHILLNEIASIGFPLTRFGRGRDMAIMKHNGLTLKFIGKEYDITDERVRQLILEYLYSAEKIKKKYAPDV